MENIIGVVVLAKKKKLSKKQIQEDKLVTSYYQARKFYDKHQTRLFAVVGVVAVIVLAVFWYSSKVKQENQQATVELARVIPLYNQGAYLDAIEGKPGTNVLGLKKISDEFSGSDQGEVARIYLANAYYFTGKFEDALKEYDNFSGSNKLMIAAALAGKAACYEVNNNFADAAKNYYKAANVDEYNPQNPDYLLSAAKNYIDNKENDEAKDILKKIKEDFKNSQAARDADKYMALANI